MKRLTAKEIKKILLGTILSDGYLQETQGGSVRFELFTKVKEHADYITNVLKQITGVFVNCKPKFDKRYNKYIGYRIWTRTHPYFKNLHKQFYEDSKKVLNNYVISRLDSEALAHIWMCDGLLNRAKNRKTNKVQNVGEFCLESFDENELEDLHCHLYNKFGIDTTFKSVIWGKGFRLRIGGKGLQKFISLIYPYVLPSFHYKTWLFYKKDSKYADIELANAKQYLKEYSDVEDIVRYLQQCKINNDGTTSPS